MKRTLVTVLLLAVVVVAVLWAVRWLDLGGMISRMHGH